MVHCHFTKEMVYDINLYFLWITNKISDAAEFGTDMTNPDAQDPE